MSYIINPATGRKVLSSGKIGQSILRNSATIKKAIKKSMVQPNKIYWEIIGLAPDGTIGVGLSSRYKHRSDVVKSLVDMRPDYRYIIVTPEEGARIRAQVPRFKRSRYSS
jgi:hypothetical protein